MNLSSQNGFAQQIKIVHFLSHTHKTLFIHLQKDSGYFELKKGLIKKNYVSLLRISETLKNFLLNRKLVLCQCEIYAFDEYSRLEFNRGCRSSHIIWCRKYHTYYPAPDRTYKRSHNCLENCYTRGCGLKVHVAACLIDRSGKQWD